MDRIKQTAKALCCWGTAALPPASPDSSSGRGSPAPSLSSAFMPASIAGEHARRQQIVENRGDGLSTATTGEVGVAGGDIALSTSPESEVRMAPVPEPVAQSAAPHDVFSALFSLSPEETPRSTVVPQPQPQPGTHDSTPSSLAYSEFSTASSSSSSHGMLMRLRGLRLIEPPTSAGAFLSTRSLTVSQRSAFTPLNRSDDRVGLLEDVAVNSSIRELSRSSAPVTAVRPGQPENDRDDTDSGSPGGALPEPRPRQYVPPGHSGVVTWLNLFEEIPEHTEYVGSHPVHGGFNPVANLPPSNLPHGGIAPTIPQANASSAAAGSGATDQENVVTLPLMPLLRDMDRASRPLLMRRQQRAPDEGEGPHLPGLDQGYWPSAPVAPASLPRNTESDGVSSASSSSSSDSSK
ncbi:MAG: hypothetical protein ACI9ZF_001356 [Bradyrhizobium sp.]|jgi:hypothetical protein